MNRNLQIYLYSWHMPIFFIISGILLQYRDSWRYRSYKDTVVRKAKSLLYPYLTFSFLTTIYSIKFGVGTSEIVMSFYKNIGANILVQDLIGTVLGIGIWLLWFLPALFFGELLAIAILKQSQRIRSMSLS
ncbi:acyltransferase family protein [Lactobacillus delbrueckii]|uniref:acyltransferase family protein n=1 Tax=Lactobacillus delbrueckii TaxID=1584 RepID=UPI0039C87EAF